MPLYSKKLSSLGSFQLLYVKSTSPLSMCVGSSRKLANSKNWSSVIDRPKRATRDQPDGASKKRPFLDFA